MFHHFIALFIHPDYTRCRIHYETTHQQFTRLHRRNILWIRWWTCRISWPAM